MTGKTHLAGGVAAALILERLAALAGLPFMAPPEPVVVLGHPLPAFALGLTVAALGSLLPDLDEPNSLVSNLPRAGRGVVRSTLRAKGVEGVVRMLVEFGLMFINLFTRALSGLVRACAFGHRGATHWLITAVVLGLAAAGSGWFIGFPALGLWLFIGYASHLALDAMTISGLEMFQPLTGRTVHLLPKPMWIRTGSIVDSLLGGCFGLVIAAAMFWQLAGATPTISRQWWQHLIGQ